MPSFDREYFNMGYLDSLSYKDTFVHRLDPRIKLTVILAFVVTVVSFNKYAVLSLAPFFILPVFFLSFGDIPAGFIFKKVLIVAPFAFFVGIFNPVLDTDTLYTIGGMEISGGWVSFLSIMIKFVLTISAALLLIATTSFPGVCHALVRLRAPEIFVSQLLFLYRYIFVLMEEAMKILRARDMRSFEKRGKEMKVFINLIGVLFIRTIERSERIYQAMLSRGFHGRIDTMKVHRLSAADIVFALISLVLLYLFRRYDVVSIAGDLFSRFL